MARIYEHPDPKHIAGAAAYVEGTGQASRMGGILTAVALAAVAGGALFGWAYYRSGSVERAGLAALIGVAAITAVYLLTRALRREPAKDSLGKLPVTVPERRVELVLEQLDDRFAVFRNVKAEETVIDHLIVGPTGVFTVVDMAEGPGAPRESEIHRRAEEECQALRALLAKLLPQAQPHIQPVVCVAPGSGRVDKDSRGVWVVPADKLAAGLIKRSGQEGSIGHNVNETGAFSSDALQSAAIERALAAHWSIPTRKRIADYLSPGVDTAKSA